MLYAINSTDKLATNPGRNKHVEIQKIPHWRQVVSDQK